MATRRGIFTGDTNIGSGRVRPQSENLKDLAGISHGFRSAASFFGEELFPAAIAKSQEQEKMAVRSLLDMSFQKSLVCPLWKRPEDEVHIKEDRNVLRERSIQTGSQPTFAPNLRILRTTRSSVCSLIDCPIRAERQHECHPRYCPGFNRRRCSRRISVGS